MKKFWQKILVGALAFAMVFALAACGEKDNQEPQKETLFATTDDFPIMDGSTANLPLMAQVMADTCGVTLEEAQELVSCTTTPNAWLRLAQGDADILLVYEAADVTKKQLEGIGTALEITPIGRDALVFINNSDNPVKSLTEQQLLDIYTGTITNWKEVGGEDKEIVAYQRSEDSGSQSLFMKLLMKEITPMAAPTELKPTEMGMLIDQLASYNNSANALGYSVFYYASYMYQQPGLKFLAVNDVEPSNETIADGSYPFLNEYYVVIRADEPADSPARKLQEWILSEDGRKAIETAGYIAVPAEKNE